MTSRCFLLLEQHTLSAVCPFQKEAIYKISKENKTMKKHSIKLTALVLALVLTAALALTGCGSKSDDSDGATTIQIAVPNDTTNEARALLLLQDNGIIKLADGAGITATKNDIVENPYNVEIVETEAAQIPNILQDVDYAVINSNYAINAGLNPVADSLVIEGSASAYANILAVKEGNESSPKVLALIAALESQQVVDYINEKYDGSVVSTVDTPTDGFDATVDYDALSGETISIAASPTPHAEILEVVKEILAEKNITLDIQVYNDYVVPNTVVEDGTVDANYFQHKPYLDDFNAENNTHIVSVAAIHVEPMGLYGGKQTTLDALSAK
jgi:D-methionine transport system substrate-binding protein